MPEKVLPAMFRKQKDTKPLSGADLYRGPSSGVPIRARYGEDVADRAASRLNALRSSDRGPFEGHSGTGGAPPPGVKRTTIIEEHAPSQDADVLADKYDQKKRLGY